MATKEATKHEAPKTNHANHTPAQAAPAEAPKTRGREADPNSKMSQIKALIEQHRKADGSPDVAGVVKTMKERGQVVAYQYVYAIAFPDKVAPARARAQAKQQAKKKEAAQLAKAAK